MVEIDQKPRPQNSRSVHVSMTTLTAAGAVFALVTFVSGYVTGIMTMRDTIAGLRTDYSATVARETEIDKRMEKIERQNEKILDSFNEFKLRSGTKQ